MDYEGVSKLQIGDKVKTTEGIGIVTNKHIRETWVKLENGEAWIFPPHDILEKISKDKELP